jgi:hypothetical protein
VTLLGTIQVEHRPYYLCTSCHRGFFPGDVTLRLEGTRLSLGAEEILALGGILTSFEVAADTILPKLTGLHVGESTVERTTEAVGQGLGEDLARGDTFGERTTWPWHTDAEGDTCAYISVDATGVGIQGPHGSKAPGRMVTVGMIYNPLPPQPDPPRAQPRLPRPAAVAQARYLAGSYDLDGIGAQLRRQADAVGLWQADRVIALTDGGNGLEPMLRRDFDGAELILDFWHAAEHLSGLAKLYAADTTASTTAEALTHRWCHRMKQEGGAAILDTLRGLDLTGCSTATREDHRQLLQHFEKNLPRMDYPQYQRRGWHIGSGSVEAACKTVIGGRLKGAGMRWGEDGADAVSHLRALFLSEKGQWDAFWAASRN